MTGDVSQSVE